jgi:hypothetical protein
MFRYIVQHVTGMVRTCSDLITSERRLDYIVTFG